VHGGYDLYYKSKNKWKFFSSNSHLFFSSNSGPLTPHAGPTSNSGLLTPHAGPTRHVVWWQKGATTIKIAIWGVFLSETKFFCHPTHAYPPSCTRDGPTLTRPLAYQSYHDADMAWSPRNCCWSAPRWRGKKLAAAVLQTHCRAGHSLNPGPKK
jgi:hypothetical protein